MKVKIKMVGDVAVPTPRRMSQHASGFDVCAAVGKPVYIWPGKRALVPTGIALEVPPGYECQVRPRSGLAVKHGVTVLNGPGTIDADYRGEVSVVLINTGWHNMVVNPGDRIAQLVFAAVEQPDLEVVDELSDTERGEGGMGSTGE